MRITYHREMELADDVIPVRVECLNEEIADTIKEYSNDDVVYISSNAYHLFVYVNGDRLDVWY